MRIFLEKNWSEQFIYGDETPGFFVGRKQEIKSLKSVINNNNSSAILISSVRGVGKTSFVHKALDEIKRVYPVFVNIGHTFSNEDVGEKKSKKLILKSLIRAIHFNKSFENDKNLKKIYEKSLGVYRAEEEQKKQTETEKNVGLSADIKLNAKTLIPVLGVFLLVLGFSLDNSLARTIIGTLGISVLLLSFSWKRSWTDSLIKKEKFLIDDSTEYLEIEFENWLKEQDKKIVFVIDELDKIKLSDNREIFDIIKEYKNLFTRSFAHFIFITDQRAFDLVNKDREDEEKGIFPTFFTHIFYLSLPNAGELRLYLNEIFKKNENTDEIEKDKLVGYLLFRSGNDFFTLKRLLSDVIIFNDNNDEPFIDTDKIKNSDEHFSKVAKLFGYVEKWFLQKYQYELKKYWKDNSELQKEIFNFLNDKFNPPVNFSYENDIKGKINLENLSNFLIDIGIIEKKITTVESGLKEGDFEYIWTHKYKRDVNAPLIEDDKKFQESFDNLVKVANDLDDLPRYYKTGKFEKYDYVSEGDDGSGVSGISLNSTYSDYENIHRKLKSASERITITKNKVQEGRKILDEQTENVFSKYFEIFINLLDQHILIEKQNLFVNQQLSQRPQIFSSCPNFRTIFAPIIHRIYGKADDTRSVMIVKDFSDFGSIYDGLKSLIDQKNILIINIKRDEEYKKEPIEIEIDYQDTIGRNRKKKAKIKNFINFSFNDFRQFSDILKLIEEHLAE